MLIKASTAQRANEQVGMYEALLAWVHLLGLLHYRAMKSLTRWVACSSGAGPAGASAFTPSPGDTAVVSAADAAAVCCLSRDNLSSLVSQVAPEPGYTNTSACRQHQAAFTSQLLEASNGRQLPYSRHGHRLVTWHERGSPTEPSQFCESGQTDGNV